MGKTMIQQPSISRRKYRRMLDRCDVLANIVSNQEENHTAQAERVAKRILRDVAKNKNVMGLGETFLKLKRNFENREFEKFIETCRDLSRSQVSQAA